jgi:glucan biosynthesis protein C
MDPSSAEKGFCTFSRIGPAVLALRLLAMAFVVVAHAAMSLSFTSFYTPWPVVEPGASLVFDYVLIWLSVSLPLFFLLAGFSAGRAFSRAGPRAFLLRRTHRILCVLLIGLVTLLPVGYAVWDWAVRISGNKVPMRHSFGPMHLWFLEYLLLFCFGLWCLRTLGGTLRPRLRIPWPGAQLGERLWCSAWKPLLLAVPTFLILCLNVDAIIYFTNTFVPNPTRVLFFGLFFALGTGYPRGRRAEESLHHHGPLYLLLSIPAFVAMSHLLMRHVLEPLDGARWLLLCAASAIFYWLTVFGLFGLSLRLFPRRNEVVAHLSGASYWVYLTHFPLVIFLQVLAYSIPGHVVLKLLVVVAAALALTLLPYQTLVRYTAIASFLNGSRSRAPLAPSRWSLALKLAPLCLLTAVIVLGLRRYQFVSDSKISVAANRVFLGDEPSSRELGTLIARLRLRTIVSLAGEETAKAEIEGCRARGVDCHVLRLANEDSPGPEELQALVELVSACPRPVLVHSRSSNRSKAVATALHEGVKPYSGRRDLFTANHGRPAGSEQAGPIDLDGWQIMKGRYHCIAPANSDPGEGSP